MKYTFFTLLFIASFCSLQAQDMKQLFINLPDSVAPLLTKINREDCVDFLDSQMKAEVKNRFGSPSELKQLTADYLLMQTTEYSTLQLKLFPLNDSVNIIGAIYTACAPVCDSQLRFYSTDWHLLKTADYISLPTDDDFLLPNNGRDDYLSMRNQLDMNLQKIEVTPDSKQLFFTYTIPEYLSEKAYKECTPYLRPMPLKYVWMNGKFELAEE
ncbi:MAG: DUF3256 family protein [Phocaeicola sp.]